MNENKFKISTSVEELLHLSQQGLIPHPRPGHLQEVTLLHDDNCNIFNGAKCSCNPTVKNGAPNRAERRAAKRQK